MALIKHDRIVADPWIRVADDAALPADGRAALIGLDRWHRDRAALQNHNGPLGLLLKSDQSPAAVAGDLDRFDLIALEFPKFTDGRAYSYARLLRRRCRFAGEVRAVGYVLRDQVSFMVRCGFDAFEMKKDEDATAFVRALGQIETVYQPAADDRVPAWQRRAASPAPTPTSPSDTRAGAWAC